MDHNWGVHTATVGLRAPAANGRLNAAGMLGRVAMGPAWQWFPIVTGSLFLVPAADAMIPANRHESAVDPLD